MFSMLHVATQINQKIRYMVLLRCMECGRMCRNVNEAGERETTAGTEVTVRSAAGNAGHRNVRSNACPVVTNGGTRVGVMQRQPCGVHRRDGALRSAVGDPVMIARTGKRYVESTTRVTWCRTRKRAHEVSRVCDVRVVCEHARETGALLRHR